MKEQTKKTYNKPEVKTIHCCPMQLICQSALDGGDNNDDNNVNEDDALAGFRNDGWGDLW